MNFKISDAICAGDQSASDIQQDFLYKVDQWRKSSQVRKTSRSTRKNTPKQVPDQRNQPFIPAHKIHHASKTNRSKTFSAQSQKLTESSNKKKTDSEIKKFPSFNLANELPIQIIPFSTKKAPDSKTTNQRKIQIPRSTHESRQGRSISNPILRLVDVENQIELLEKKKIEEKKKTEEDHNQFIHQKQIMPQLGKSIISTSSSLKAPVLLSDDIYYSKLVDHGQWSVIWDINKITNVPLILDRSDKYISFTETDISESSKNTIREWNNLNLLSKVPNFYSPMQSNTQTNEDQNIHNSEPALSLELVEPNITDFENFHHPAYNAPLKTEMTITYLPAVKQIKDDSPFINSVESLSAKHGDVYVIEHTVENPPFVLNVGMNSLLITYWFKESENDIPKINEDFKTLKILEPNEQSPFIAQLPRNKPIQSIYCPLYRMPIAKHNQNKTDFLLIKDRFHQKFYIRRFDSIFCAGMLEPLKEVMTPSAKVTQKFQESFMNAILINIFRGTSEFKRRDQVQVTQIQHSYFPDANDQKLRKILKKYAEFNREQGNGFWKFKPNSTINLESEFNQLEVTPEKVCRYQSMLVGKWRLRQNGVNLLTSSPRLYMQIKKLSGERTKLIAEKIELELMKTPWAKTTSFTGAFQSNAIEMQNADGEYVVRKKSRRQKIENPEQAQQNKRKLVGTKADLRTLSLAELDQNLSAAGVTREDLKTMSRWKKVGVLREFQTRKFQDNPNTEDTLIYARGSRNGYKESLKKYKQQYQQTFESNLNFISTPEENNIEKGDFDDGNILDELEIELMHNDQRDEDEDEDEDLFDNEEPSQEEDKSGASKATKPKFQSSGDPKELVPYGICTYPTKIDWAAYGFDPETTQMRPVVKLIRVSLNTTGVDVKVEWIRSPHEIEETRKRPNVFTDIGSQVLNFEESILAERKKQIQDKLRRRNHKKSKNANCNCLGYIPSHTFLLVHEDSNGQFRFQLTPDVVDYINDARRQYENYKNSNHTSDYYGFSSHPKSEKVFSSTSSTSTSASSSSSKSSKSSSKSKSSGQPQKKKGNHIFNDELKKILEDSGKDLFPQFYFTKDQQAPSLKAMAMKGENHGFKSVSDFMKDLKQLSDYYIDYYKDKDPSLTKKAEELYSEFKNKVENNYIISKYEEQRKKRALNLHSKKSAEKNPSAK